MIKRPKRLLADESGFTLPEVLVTILIMTTVMFALYSLFDMSIRVFGFGNSKVEATENARLGLGRMEREIRAAYPANKPGGDDKLFSEWTPTSITFGNDLDGDKQTPPCVTGPMPPPCEIISYEIFQPSGSKTYALGRANDAAGILEPVIEYVDYEDSSSTGLRFRYYEANGTEVIPVSGDEADIDVVRIELRVEVDRTGNPAAQTLSTDVSLRNRGNGVASAPPPTAAPACSDGIDNDDDGKIDFGNDPGCASPDDTDETDPAPPPDTTPPDTIIDSNPPDPDPSTTADFTFSATESGSTFECSLDGGAWSDCSSPTQYTGLSSGPHTFEVRARDAAGNSNPTPANYTWTVNPPPPADTTPPDTNITSGPAEGSSTTSTSANFEFDASEGGSTFECRLDGGTWSACTSPRQYDSLSVGSHTFEVRATDAAGNTGQTPASRTWTVVSVPPPDAVNDGSNANNAARIQIRQSGPNRNSPLTINVLANDSPNAGASLSITSVTQPSVGTRVTISADRKSIIYTAQSGGGDRGNFQFTYTVRDQQGRTDTATVFVRVVNN